MRKIIISIFLGKLGRASGFLFFASIAGGAIGYFYQILIARLLSPAEYGVMVAMMAFLAILSVPLGAYVMLLSRDFSSLYAQGNIFEFLRRYREAWRRISLAALIFLAFYLVLLLSGIIQSYLKVGSRWDELSFGILVTVSILTVPNVSAFQGMQNFRMLGLNGIAGNVGKVIFGVGFVVLGWGVSGVFGGIVVTTILILLHNQMAIKQQLNNGLIFQENKINPEINSKIPASSSIYPLLLANLAFIIMSQFDMILVKTYFTPEQTGIYAAAAVLGKTIMYLPGALVIALFPMVAENESLDRGSFSLLLQGLVITTFLSCFGGVILYFFASPLINLLFGSAYAEAGKILQYYSLAMIPLAIVTIVEYFLIAKRRFLFAYLMLAVVPIEIILVAYFHENLLQIVWIMTVCGWLLLVVGMFAIGFQNRLEIYSFIKTKKKSAL
jgi:O-antigen/teichoic acid export membrane protein